MKYFYKTMIIASYTSKYLSANIVTSYY